VSGACSKISLGSYNSFLTILISQNKYKNLKMLTENNLISKLFANIGNVKEIPI
jgi:hypothetical protein